jgi:hypothetical protein
MDTFNDIIKQRKRVKPPAYPWQELALQIIQELAIPDNKRSSIFKVCKQESPQLIKRALNDTKELCKQGSTWRYFFKIIDQEKNKK